MYLVGDVGGTNTRIALSRDGKIVGEPVIWKTPENFEEGMEKFRAEAEKVLQNVQLRAAAIGVAGVIDNKRRKLVKSPHLENWVDKPLASKLEDITQVKVILENDAALGALGEAVTGAGRRSEIVAYLTISTGIGGARVVQGKIDRKRIGFEPGHMIIDVAGKVGYWEEFASGTAMEKVYKKSPEEITDSEAWDSEARLLSIGIHNVAVMWSPDVVVLGGSVMKSVDLDRVKAYLGQQMNIFPEVPELKKAELGDRSGLVGALELVSTEHPL